MYSLCIFIILMKIETNTIALIKLFHRTFKIITNGITEPVTVHDNRIRHAALTAGSDMLH